MENASKALLMAAEILISIVIISALMLMFNSLTSYQGEQEETTREAQIIKFNNQYEAYNVSDVRGNELYSLINKVVDYNERKSEEGTEGQDWKYQNMTIYVNLVSEAGKDARDDFKAPDGELRIFDDSNAGKEFTISKTSNDFEKLFTTDTSKKKSIQTILNDYSSSALTNLTLAMESIFKDDTDLTVDEKKEVIYTYNDATGQSLSVKNSSDIKKNYDDIQEQKDDVYTYYEYLQFTRAHFKCTGVEYNSNTGRIVKMSFQYTGKIN